MPTEPTQKDRDAAVDSLNCPPGTSIVTACAQAIATARAEGRAEAIALWNAVVAPDATRLAAVVRAVDERRRMSRVVGDPSPSGTYAEEYVRLLKIEDAALDALTPDDMALLERWEVGK